MRRFALAGLIVLASAIAAVALDAPTPQDRGVIDRCLAAAAKQRRDGAVERCIGRVASPCLARPENLSTAAQAFCAEREARVWDERLNRAYRTLQTSDKLEPEQKDKLREMQRAWIDLVGKKCAFYWDFYQGTMAVPMGAYCDMAERARQALWLAGFSDDLAGR